MRIGVPGFGFEQNYAPIEGENTHILLQNTSYPNDIGTKM